MGVEGLEPSRLLRSTDFHPFTAFAVTFTLEALRIGLSLHPRLYVRVAPVESLHLPDSHDFQINLIILNFQAWLRIALFPKKLRFP
jgi:hypothetical protein